MLDSTRRGFFAGLVGAAGALRGAMTGATPPIVPECRIKPAPSEDFFEFLMRMHLEGREFFLHGDISGFAKNLALNAEYNHIDVTAFGDYQSRWTPIYSRRYIELEIPFRDVQFKLEANIEPSGMVCHSGLVNPSDLPKTSCVFPLKGKGAAVELVKNRFFVKCVEFHHGVGDGLTLLS